MQNSPTSFTDPTGNTPVSSGASWRPTASDIQDVTGRYNRYLNWLSTVWNAVMFKAGGTNLITTVNISNVGYFHVYSPSKFLQPSEWMATIAYDRNDPDDMLIAELTARRIQDRMTVDAIGGITTSAIVNGFDIAIRTAFDPIDTLASFVEFTKKPSWSAVLGMVPLTPVPMGRFAGLTPTEAVIGKELDYLFGRATGRQHNLDRSADMLRQMERIGMPDSSGNRRIMTDHFQNVLNDASNIVTTQDNGKVVRESLLMGPNGGVKIQSIWDGARLETFALLGVGSRYRHLP